jgi:hypothetical protein
MRLRENRVKIEDSLATTLEVEDRDQMFRHIFDTLGKKDIVVTDEMVHVTHYGFDERIDWDEYIIVVDRFGVFGFTDAPCPPNTVSILQARVEESVQRSAEVESAYGLNR